MRALTTTGSRGRRVGLTRQQVFDAALRLADAEGVEALSMRKLGRALDVEAMSLYHHVPNRAAILDGLAEAVFVEVELPDPVPGADWRAQLAATLTALRTHLLRHPGALPVLATREATGPGGLRLLEAGLTLLTEAGFDVVDAGYLLNNVTMFTIGHCLAMVGRQPLGERDPTPEQRAALFDALADHPTVAAYLGRVQAEGFDAERLYRQGLTALLDGARPPS